MYFLKLNLPTDCAIYRNRSCTTHGDTTGRVTIAWYVGVVQFIVRRDHVR